MAAAVALLWPVSTQSGSSEARSSICGVAAQGASGLRLSEEDEELSEVSPACCVMCHKHICALRAQTFDRGNFLRCLL